MSRADELDEALTLLSETEAYIEAAIAPQKLALQRIAKVKAEIQQALKRGVKHAIEQPFATVPPACAHRRAHRPGRPRKIDSDTELRAFIEARIDRMTFVDLEAEIAKNFPPDRRVRKSAIHAWWTSTQKGSRYNG
jgi:hypothetical protein